MAVDLIKADGVRDKNGILKLKYLCHCGNVFYAYPGNVRSENTTSCGCERWKRDQNQRHCVRVMVDGEEMLITHATKRIGISMGALHKHMKKYYKTHQEAIAYYVLKLDSDKREMLKDEGIIH
jgi:hypothetical protein